jgi:hypothetical protein
MEDTSVTAGDRKKPADQFATQGLYQDYMRMVMKNAPAPKQPIPRHGDQSIQSVGELGESKGKTSIQPVREVARGKKTAQSSMLFSAASARAVDGRTDMIFNQGSCTHTKRDKNPWWRVDLGKSMNVQHLQIWNRGDCCGSRLSNFEVRIGASKRKWTKNPRCGRRWTIPQGQNMKIPCTALQGRYVFIVVRATQFLSLCEVKVFASDSPGSNAARGMPSAQSSTKNGGTSDRAVDGRATTQYADNSCTHTNFESNPWWRVDLGRTSTVKSVQIWNRGDCCGSRLSNFEVRVGDNAGAWSSCKKCGNKWAIRQGKNKEISCGGQRGRYVFVVIRARQVLTLCEVRVLTTYSKKGGNLARNKPTKQSSTGYGGVSKRAVDGNIDTTMKSGSCTHTHLNQEPWWRVDLLRQRAVGAVQIWNRGDCCGARLSNFEVRVGNMKRWMGNKVCGGKKNSIPQGKRKTIICGGLLGRYVFVVIRAKQYLTLCEVRVLPWKGSQQSGCTSEALGMESRKILKADVSASSFFGDKDAHGPNNARLNYRGNAWQAKYNKPGQYLQVALKKRRRVTAIATQGSFASNQWVTKYRVRYFARGRWKWLRQKFNGNIDRNTIKKNKFHEPVLTNKIRVYPANWAKAISMRMELYGRNCRKRRQPTRGSSRPGAGGRPGCSKGRRRRSLKLMASPGYGRGVARLWYAASKGSKSKGGTAGKSVYVSRGVDFRTQDGSIYAARNLVAGKYVQIKAFPGFGTGDAKLWFAKRARKAFRANTVYLQKGDFRTQKGSVYSSQDVHAGRFMQLAAFPGYGSGVARLWYAAAAKSKGATKFAPKTLYLKDGDFATQRGSLVAAKDVVAQRYLSVNAFPKYGRGTAQFWYVAAGKSPFKSNTVYLKDGDLATQKGSISAKNDVSASRYLRLSALKGYGKGEAKFWFAETAKNGLGPNTVYLKNGDLRTQSGSIMASKSVIAGRFVEIKAWPGFGNGAAQLWYSQAGKDKFKPNSIYLKTGDFRTQVGSIVAAKDLSAGRFVKIASMVGHGQGEAKLWYSQSAKGNFAGTTLYLKEGDFRTQTGSIFAGHSLKASRYLSLRAFPGFGTGEAQLWHCNKDKAGFKANSLYLKSGDFRTQAGSVYAAKDIVASRYIQLKALPGYGTGHTKLWYSQTGKGRYRSNSLYLASGDFRTELGSIHAEQSIHAGKYLKIAAWPGHGKGYAKLWHSKTGHSGFGANTLYLNDGHFQVQKGSLIASTNVQVGRYVKIGAMPGYGSGHTRLWYSGAGKDKIFPNTLYVQSGDFRTQAGSIASAKDIVAGGTLYGAKLDVKFAYVPGQITAGHLYLGGGAPKAAKPTAPAQLETTELLDVGGKQEEVMEVGGVLRSLSNSNSELTAKNSALKKDLDAVMARIDALERLASRR